MELVYKIILFIFFAIQFVLVVYLLIPFFLLFIHTFILKGKKMLEKKYPKMNDREYDFAAIVTAHQDIRFIPPLVDSFCKQSYTNFIVYVIADDCNTIDLHFNDPRIKILKPEQALNAKIQSIKYAVDHFIRAHDVMVVFDSDNLVHPDYFVNLNQYFQRGFSAVQTHMLSKNSDTIFAKLDSIGHIYNTFVERQAKMELGLSSSILGLGIAIETNLYKQVIYKEVLGGFDKKLQADIILSVPQLAFAENAIVYDEKVEDGITLEKQRTRWIYTYFEYFHVNWKIFLEGWKKLNFNLIYFGFTALKPPLFITIILSILCMGISFFIDPPLVIIWATVLLLFFITFFVIVITQSRQKGMFKAIFYIPLIVVRQISALLKIKRASKDFLKTEHIKIIYIDELLKNETV